MKIGETTRRIVTLEAQGLVAEGLPPRPVMRTRGILTFAGPVTRETIITPTGPVARATYQWDVRPAVTEIVPLDAITIPWFDTVSRTLREAEIPARQIGGGLPDRDEDAKPVAPASPMVVAAAAVGAFGFGLALIGFGVPRRSRTLRLDRATRRELARHAEAGDGLGFRAALGPVFEREPELARLWRSHSGHLRGTGRPRRLALWPNRGSDAGPGSISRQPVEAVQDRQAFRRAGQPVGGSRWSGFATVTFRSPCSENFEPRPRTESWAVNAYRQGFRRREHAAG